LFQELNNSLKERFEEAKQYLGLGLDVRNQGRTDNAIAKKKKKRPTSIHKPLPRKLINSTYNLSCI
jgi:hypothetical protein